MSAETVRKSVVVIGGGTGNHTVLKGLKKYRKKVDITAVVSMADSGGSTGRLRDEFGQLPVGDVHMALAALASDVDEHEELVRELFLHRFDRGSGLSGHNFGNLFLVALTELLGSEEAAILAASRVLRVQGTVIPVTNESVHLVATYEDGTVVTGEHDIDEPDPEHHHTRITRLSVTPNATVNPRAEDAILNADLIILGPGDLYTSILANCVIDGVADAIRHSSAKLLYICNLMTKVGQTLGFDAEAHLAEITKYVGRTPDFIMVNNGKFPAELLARYEKEGEFPVSATLTTEKSELLMGDFLAKEEVATKSGDVLRRSLIRHDTRKLARAIMELL